MREQTQPEEAILGDFIKFHNAYRLVIQARAFKEFMRHEKLISDGARRRMCTCATLKINIILHNGHFSI